MAPEAYGLDVDNSSKLPSDESGESREMIIARKPMVTRFRLAESQVLQISTITSREQL
jgi:hypothetical protein